MVQSICSVVRSQIIEYHQGGLSNGNAVEVELVSHFLLELFARWGKCGAVRVDNSLPFGNMSIKVFRSCLS